MDRVCQKTAEHIAENINENIYDQKFSFVEVPYQINDINRKIIENRILDLSDDNQRDRYFAWNLKTHSKDIYSLGYGTSAGAYYSARRNEDGVIEIMKNNSVTGGNSWYYSVREDYTAGELVLQAGQFDPRTRAWYQAAAEKKGPVFSPIYKHFVMDDLTVSAASPIYSETGDLQGVLGTHLLLSNIGTFLNDTVDEYKRISFIIEQESHNLIANSMGLPNFTVLEDGALERYALMDVSDPDVQNVYRQYSQNNTQQQTYQGESGDYFINAREIHLDGIDWIVLSAIPQSFFIADVYTSIWRASAIAALSALLAVLAYHLLVSHSLKPLKTLLEVSNELTTGTLSKRIEVVKKDELGLISNSVNRVADTLQSLINNLETMVQKRTEELRTTFILLKQARMIFG